MLDSALHAALGGSLGAFATPPSAQGPQATLLNTESATLMSQISEKSLSILDDRPRSGNSLGSQSGISMQPTVSNQASDLGIGQKVVQKPF